MCRSPASSSTPEDATVSVTTADIKEALDNITNVLGFVVKRVDKVEVALNSQSRMMSCGDGTPRRHKHVDSASPCSAMVLQDGQSLTFLLKSG